MGISQKTGWLLLAGAVGVLIPYTLLTVTFEYPDILRQETGSILSKFHQGGPGLIFTWFAFALIGLPLIPAYIFMGQMWKNRTPWMRVATTMGVAGLIVQMMGLLRWTFVVPVLSDLYVHAPDQATKTVAVVAFKTIHQLFGVLLGEHLGQLFTVLWTILISIILLKHTDFPQWIGAMGITSAAIYFLAQAELLTTVIPSLPMWEPAGFIGSTLWLFWLMVVGIRLIRTKTPIL